MKAGFSEVDFTPRAKLPLMGNFRSHYEARGVHDPLMARAAVFSNAAGEWVAVLSLDLGMVSRSNTAFLRNEIFRKTGIPKENIFVAATHTHSAPSPMPNGILPAAPENEVKKFLSKASEAVVVAKKRAKLRRMFHGSVKEDGVSFVRRLWSREGKVRMNWEAPDPSSIKKVLGSPDPELQVIRIGEPGRPDGILVHFGLHPAILAGDNWLYSADFPGVLSATLKKLFSNKDLVVIFLNGCCGNVNHIDYQDPLQGRGYAMVERVGSMLGVAAFEALRSAKPLKGETLSCLMEKVRLPRHAVSEEQVAWAKKTLTGGEKEDGLVDGLPARHFATRYLEMHELQNEPDLVEMQALRIGEAAILGFPGEVFAQTGLEVKEKFPAVVTFPVMLANDAIGYLPTLAAHREGGYEALLGSASYAPGAAEKLRDSGIAMIRKLFTSKRGKR